MDGLLYQKPTAGGSLARVLAHELGHAFHARAIGRDAFLALVRLAPRVVEYEAVSWENVRPGTTSNRSGAVMVLASGPYVVRFDPAVDDRCRSFQAVRMVRHYG